VLYAQFVLWMIWPLMFWHGVVWVRTQPRTDCHIARERKGRKLDTGRKVGRKTTEQYIKEAAKTFIKGKGRVVPVLT
jgi:hypothetical protein